jgi:hypothetical protein
MYLFLRQFGAAIGVGVGGSTFQNVMALKLEWEGLPAEIASEAELYVAQLHLLPDGSDEKSKILDAYRFGFAGVFQVYLGVAAVALILSVLFIKHYSLDKTLSTQHTLHESRASKLLVGGSRMTTPSPTLWDSTTDINSYNPGAYNMDTNGQNGYNPSMYYHSDGSAYIPAVYQPEFNTNNSNIYHENASGYPAAHQPAADIYYSNEQNSEASVLIPAAYHPQEHGNNPYAAIQL